MEKNNFFVNIEQGRANFAYKCAKKGSKIDKKNEYKQYVKKIPMLIKTNGIGATLAFIKSKSSNDKTKSGYAYKIIYDQINEWLKLDEKKLLEDFKENSSDLLEITLNLNSPLYRTITIEVLLFLNWLKRFAEGLIEGEKNE
ncbi:MAG: type III-B CRISPR module-associated protein Cmr5 [Candidatus Lokiarchaeota archaeon]|nr:type III-B CRISPR module-associated protein Cmr5 [Candidatus Harpocratesius repetitus]